MKKIYLVLIGVSMSVLTFGQIPVSWAIKLPADYKESPLTRQELDVKQVVDADVTGADNLGALWGTIDAQFVNPVDALVSGTNEIMPEQAPEDFTGEFAVMAGADALYVLFNVTDNEWSETGDGCEVVIAPYVDAVDVDPANIIADSSTWNWDAANHDYYSWYGTSDIVANPDNFDIHDMARYGLWASRGASKLGTIPAKTDVELFAGTFNFSPVEQISGTDMIQLDGDADGGSTNVATPTYVEAKTGGYIQLVIIPWEVMDDNKLTTNGDQMSIAVQLRDNTDNVDSTYVYWGGSESNDAFWSPVFYGAKATFVETVGISNAAISDLNVYYTNSEIVVEDNVKAITIYNVTGAKVMSLNNPEGNVSVSNLIKGVYIAKIQTTDGKVGVLKFVK